jgi:predicted metal-binding membrane protein
MAVMFAVGVMNVVWIAGLGALMTLEKATHGLWPSRWIGGALIAAAIGVLVTSPVATHVFGAH